MLIILVLVFEKVSIVFIFLKRS